MLPLERLLLKRGLLGKSQRAQHAHPVAQPRRHDVGIDVLENNWNLDVPVEQCQHFSLNQREEMALAHDTAAQDDTLRRENAHEGDTGQRQEHQEAARLGPVAPDRASPIIELVERPPGAFEIGRALGRQRDRTGRAAKKRDAKRFFEARHAPARRGR